MLILSISENSIIRFIDSEKKIETNIKRSSFLLYMNPMHSKLLPVVRLKNNFLTEQKKLIFRVLPLGNIIFRSGLNLHTPFTIMQHVYCIKTIMVHRIDQYL